MAGYVHFVIFHRSNKNKQMFLWSYSTAHHRICTRYSHIQCASKLPIGIPIFQYVSEWQHDKEFFFVKTPILRLWLPPRQRPLRYRQNGTGFIKRLHRGLALQTLKFW